MRIVRIAMIILLFGGCSSSGPTIEYYLLDSQSREALASRPDLTVQILDLDVPQYLERFQIASRAGANRLVFAETRQWGEALHKNILRVMGEDLRVLLGTVEVGTPASRNVTRADFSVEVHIHRFEKQADGHVELAARWQVLDPSGEVLTERAEFQGEVLAPGDYDAMAREMSGLLADLSTRIAQTILRLERQK